MNVAMEARRRASLVCRELRDQYDSVKNDHDPSTVAAGKDTGVDGDHEGGQTMVIEREPLSPHSPNNPYLSNREIYSYIIIISPNTEPSLCAVIECMKSLYPSVILPPPSLIHSSPSYPRSS